MRIWSEGGFFQSVKGHVLKWWQFVIHSVLQINNNQPNGHKGQNAAVPNQNEAGFEHSEAASENQVKTDDRSEMAKQRAQQVRQARDNQIRSMFSEMEKENSKPSGESVRQESQDPMEVLRRIKQEKEGLNSKEVQEARKKAQEQEMVASIMKANKIDVNVFIAQAKEKREAAKTLEDAKDTMSEEEMCRAQEIIDRLNREAAEDEAKKKAQVEEAKKKTKGSSGE